MHKRFANRYVAVKALTLGINDSECFGLLGHNGAGKSTLINMMCGLYEPTLGTATVDGLSVRTDLSAIQARMGVCPQDNILWDSLTCRDHVLFFGRLKGLTGLALNKAASRALADVNLYQFQHRRSGKLSGGMKRRLCVAISLIGNPLVVYLDEPSTGLDPASRRQLWDVIARAKGDKSIVLTTHSMEEADVLCDRIGIMAIGEMQAMGTASELKRRFGAGYTFAVTSSDRSGAMAQKIYDFVKSLFPSAVLLNEPIGGTSKFEVHRKEVVLSRVFETLESPQTKSAYQIVDWGITETDLESVFLHLAREADVAGHQNADLSKIGGGAGDETVAKKCCV